MFTSGASEASPWTLPSLPPMLCSLTSGQTRFDWWSNSTLARVDAPQRQHSGDSQMRPAAAALVKPLVKPYCWSNHWSKRTRRRRGRGGPGSPRAAVSAAARAFDQRSNLLDQWSNLFEHWSNLFDRWSHLFDRWSNSE